MAFLIPQVPPTVEKNVRHRLLFFQKQKPKRVKAIYNCVADNPDELTFTEGEVIVVDGEEDQEWWVSINRLFGGPPSPLAA